MQQLPIPYSLTRHGQDELRRVHSAPGANLRVVEDIRDMGWWGIKRKIRKAAKKLFNRGPAVEPLTNLNPIPHWMTVGVRLDNIRADRIAAAVSTHWLMVHARPEEFEERKWACALAHMKLSASELEEALGMEGQNLRQAA